MKKKYQKRQILLFIFMISFIIIGCIFLKLGTSNEKTLSIKYQENNDIDYKVHLKDNNFFDEEYLEKGKSYITSFIDYIHIDYFYNISFDHVIDGNYKYKIVAEIELNKDTNSSENYWTKRYDISELKEESFKLKTEINIRESVDIDYNKYNEILSDFKKKASISNTEGILKVYLDINSNIESKNIKTPLNKKLLIKLPLSQNAIEATIDMDATNNVNEISKTIKNKNIVYLIFIIIGLSFIVISVFFAYSIIKNKKLYSRKNQYEVELEKILNTYDSIIVDTTKNINIEDYNIIEVNRFEELIDAHSEVRMPINYYQTENESTFILLKDSNAWIYTLKKDDYRRSAR